MQQQRFGTAGMQHQYAVAAAQQQQQAQDDYDDEGEDYEYYYPEEDLADGSGVQPQDMHAQHMYTADGQQVVVQQPVPNIIQNSSNIVDSSSGEVIMGDLEVLEEDLDSNYEPTDQEIEEYAQYLGMDMGEDNHLFYIAKEGLKAPLPSNWKPCKASDNQIYYFNFESKELQKEHPCDDHYKKQFIREKGNEQRKKQEKVLKKQHKQLKKEQQAITQSSGYDVSGGNTGNSRGPLQHMQAAAMIDVSQSTSVIDDIVSKQLQHFVDELNNRNEQHEQLLEDELDEFRDQLEEQLREIADDGKKGIALQEQRLLKEIRSGATSGKTTAQRKVELENDKKERIKEQRSEQQRILQARQDKLRREQTKQKQTLERNEEKLHEREISSIKNQYGGKLQLEKEKQREENNQLLEESGDIDMQIKMQKSRLMNRDLQKEKAEIEQKFKDRLRQAKLEQQEQLEETRARLRRENQLKLDREKERASLKHRSAADQKIQIERQNALMELERATRDKKKHMDKLTQDKMRELRAEFDKDQEKAKADIKADLLKAFERKERLSLDKERASIKDKFEDDLQQYENEKERELGAEKKKVEREMNSNWQEEKDNFMSQEKQSHADYNSIIDQVKQSKHKIKQVQSKISELKRQIQVEKTEVGDFEGDKRNKEQDLRTQKTTSSKYAVHGVEDLEADLKQREAEHQRLRDSINQIKSLAAQRPIRHYSAAPGLNATQSSKRSTMPEYSTSANDARYDRLQSELSQLKVQLASLKCIDTNAQIKSITTTNKHVRNILDYSPDEILTQIQLDLPACKASREKLENDRIVIKQLLANIEKNRVKWLKEEQSEQEGDFGRKMALRAVKDKITGQAEALGEEEQMLKEHCDKVRRQEELLHQMEARVQKHEAERDHDRRGGMLHELQADFDKYLRLYSRESEKLKRQRKYRDESGQEVRDFQTKWSQFLCEEDKDREHELQELLGLDAYQAHPRPTSMYNSRSRHEAASTLARNRTGFNLLFDRELNKVRSQRENLHSFLTEQQRWLIRMKSDLTSCRFYYPKTTSTKVNNFMVNQCNVTGNESLVGLRNHLSDLIN